MGTLKEVFTEDPYQDRQASLALQIGRQNPPGEALPIWCSCQNGDSDLCEVFATSAFCAAHQKEYLGWLLAQPSL